MATTVTVAGSSYSVPAEGDSNYSTDLSNLFIQLATSTKVLQVSSSNFPITQDLSFGTSYGLKLQYLKSQATNPAASGQVRLGNTESVSWRNAANNADLGLSVNASDVLQFNGTGLSVGGDPVQTAITVSDTASIDLTLAANDISADIKPLSITNALISASAAIDYSKLDVPAGAVAYSKLALTNSLVNTDVSASAAIAYSKLNLSSSIVNADISGSAAIAYSKLNLATSIVNADISASAAIALSKLAALTASRALVSDGSGVVSVSAVTATELTLLSGRTGTLATLAGAEVLTNKDYDGGTATNTNRLTVPKAAKATLDALTRKEATIVYGTDTAKAYVDNGTSLIAIGSGSGGGINYVTNPDAEADTAGWATYADAAGTAPVDGTGGSPSSTFTRSTSSPLVGTASFLWTKSAANRQGEGFSYAFTIDSGYKGQQIAINYLLEVLSGTFVTADMTVWVYDVTNGVLIQPSGFQVVNTAVPGAVQPLVFQAAINSTSYRLIFHTATTSALAYSLKFDSFSVGPQVVPAGLQAKPNTIQRLTSGTAAAYTTPAGVYQIKVKLVGGGGGGGGSGTTAGSAAGSGGTTSFGTSLLSATGGGGGAQSNSPTGGTATVNSPAIQIAARAGTSTGGAHYTRSAQDLGGTNGGASPFGGSGTGGTPQSATVGGNAAANSGSGGGGGGFVNVNAGYTGNGGASGGYVEAIIPNPSSTYLYTIGAAGTAGGAGTSGVAGGTGGTGYIEIEEFYYGTNVVLSDSAATRVVAFDATGASSTHSTSATKITGQSVGVDTHGAWDAANSRYIVKVPGLYKVTTRSGVNNTAYGASVQIYKNGNSVRSASAYTNGGVNANPVATAILNLVVNDYIESFLAATAGSTGVDTNITSISIERLSGPTQIQAATRVTARYTNSATSISGPTTVVWTNKVSDTVNGMSSGEYTVQAPGDYAVDSRLLLGGTFALNVQSAIEIQKNGVRWSSTQDYAGGAVTRMNVAISDVVTDCVAGDKIRIRVECGATSPTIVSSADHNYVAVRRLSGVN